MPTVAERASAVRPAVASAVTKDGLRRTSRAIGVSHTAVSNFVTGSTPQEDVLAKYEAWAEERPEAGESPEDAMWLDEDAEWLAEKLEVVRNAHGRDGPIEPEELRKRQIDVLTGMLLMTPEPERRRRLQSVQDSLRDGLDLTEELAAVPLAAAAEVQAGRREVEERREGSRDLWRQLDRIEAQAELTATMKILKVQEIAAAIRAEAMREAEGAAKVRAEAVLEAERGTRERSEAIKEEARSAGVRTLALHVRRALPPALVRGGCDWPCHVDWDDVTVRGYLSRGELVLSTFYRRRHWWQPTTRTRGDAIVGDLTRVLLAIWRQGFEDADETGRCQRLLWMDEQGDLHYERQSTGRAVTVTLEPGVRICEVNGQGGYLVARHGEHFTVRYPEAVSIGWMRVEDQL